MKKLFLSAIAAALCVSFAAAQNNPQKSRRSDRKIIELTKIVKINPHQEEVFDFVVRHKATMPRTSLRYAIEKMPQGMKAEAMKKEK